MQKIIQKTKITFVFLLLPLLFCSLLFKYNENKPITINFLSWQTRPIGLNYLIFTTFSSGFLISLITSSTISNSPSKKSTLNYDKSIYENEDQVDKNEVDINSFKKEDESYLPDLEESMNTKIRNMPPDRDIRDPKPTLSIDYKIVSNPYNPEIRDQRRENFNFESNEKTTESKKDWGFIDYDEW